MLKQIGYEFRKLWTQTAIVCTLAILILLSLFAVLLHFDFPDSITGSGEILHGTRGVRTVAKEGCFLAGTLDQDYLDKLKQSYNTSTEKKILKEDLRKYIHKYMINSFLNTASVGMENASSWDLDLNWVQTEKDFYQRYRDSMLKSIKDDNKRYWKDTMFQYTDSQVEQIKDRIQKMETPFRVTGTVKEGISGFKYDFCTNYWIILVAIVFCLSGSFSKDSNSGLDELFLASVHGRSGAMKAKQIAGNLFATILYFLYTIMMAGLYGLTQGFFGIGSSIQFLWPTSIYPLTIGSGLLILFLVGWLVALLIANLAMLLSIKIRYFSLSALAALLLVLLLKWATRTMQMGRLFFNPLYFVTHFVSDFDRFYFVGGKMVSYIVCSLILAVIGILLAILLTKRFHKTYCIH